MPITPFHFGPGAALHALAPRRISFIAFCAVNVLIDLESLYNLVHGNFPVHTFLHTLIGATVALLATAAGFAALRAVAPVLHLPDLFGWRQLSLGQVIAGAALGAYTHVLLDGIMHEDVRPFAPFSDANPLLRLIPIERLHLLCLVLAGAGIAVLCWRAWKPSGGNAR
jgi:membrane-bound metal-dependent hydrolase YbcI (DUF457 family)